MLRDVVRFDENSDHAPDYRTEAIRSFVRVIEKKLGAEFLVERYHVPYDIPRSTREIASTLLNTNIIRGYHPSELPPDEPQIARWSVPFGSSARNVASGSSLAGRAAALVPALAEALERSLWQEDNDYFHLPKTAQANAIGRHAVLPEEFAGFSAIQRERDERLTLKEDAVYLWIRGRSLANKKDVWIPAQVASGKHGGHVFRHETEPLILSPISTGLATGETHDDALLAGMLEILERDAFMITWLNQLTPPRVDLETLGARDADVKKLLALCRRYRLDVTVVLLPTDAPAHAVCAIVHDKHGGPEVVVGLRAHRSLSRACVGALLEALRMRVTLRMMERRDGVRPEKPKGEINHLERAAYWARGARHTKLGFLTDGSKTVPNGTWERDAAGEHLQRILDWCRTRGYECAAVDIGRSKKNPTPWHVQVLVMPELQPMHQNEKLPYLGGTRLHDVPKQLGYMPREIPFIDEPHPFA